MASEVKYTVNNVVSTAWKRMAASKTTYVILAFVLAKAEMLFEGTDWQRMEAWQEFLPYVFGGVALIMIRSGIKKSELASNAVNPDVTNVQAESTQRNSIEEGY